MPRRNDKKANVKYVWAIVEKHDGYIESVHSSKPAANAALAKLKQRFGGGENFYIPKEKVNA